MRSCDVIFFIFKIKYQRGTIIIHVVHQIVQYSMKNLGKNGSTKTALKTAIIDPSIKLRRIVPKIYFKTVKIGNFRLSKINALK